jgi:hypothetical protein
VIFITGGVVVYLARVAPQELINHGFEVLQIVCLLAVYDVMRENVESTTSSETLSRLETLMKRVDRLLIEGKKDE